MYSGVSQADIVTLPLDCAGEYTSGSIWTTDFDFGVEFTDISHAYIDWSGEITAGLVELNSNPDEPFPMDVGIIAYLEPPIRANTLLLGGEPTYPEPEPFDCWSEFELEYDVENWSGLLDGQGTISVYYTEYIIIEGGYIEHGLVQLDEASLVIDGTPVPEPGTVLFLLTGSFAISNFKRKRKH